MQNNKRSFYLEDQPIHSNMADYIFDEIYKNAKQKQKCHNNPSFAYFNMITRMRNDFGNNHHDIYRKVFTPEKSQKQTRKYHTPNPGMIGNKGTFQIKKLNNRSFKIYKPRNSFLFEPKSYSPSISNINFQIQLKNEKLQSGKKKSSLAQTLAQFKKIKNKTISVTERAKTTGKTFRNNQPAKVSISRNNFISIA